MIDLLHRAENGEGVKIFIGSENKLFSLSGSSMIAAPLRGGDQRIAGVLGVIGPTRLNYGRIVPMVEYAAQMLGDLSAARAALICAAGETQCRTRRNVGTSGTVSARRSIACAQMGGDPRLRAAAGAARRGRVRLSFISTLAMVTLNGVLFVVAGAAEIGVGMHARSWGRFFLWVAGGLLYILAGIFCILYRSRPRLS